MNTRDNPYGAIKTRYKRTILEMQAAAGRKGGKCLSKKYRGSQSHLLWECAKGHRWSAVPNPIVNTSVWCPECAGRRKFTIEEMKNLAIKRGGECLSKKYVNIQTHLEWKCAKGHYWKSSPTCLLHSNTWCPYCAGVGRKTLKDMQQLAHSRGGKCLSTEYKNVTTPMLWQCKKGHQWKTRPINIIHRNTWCHTCSKYGKLTIEEMCQIAIVRGGNCLSKKYTNSYIKLRWKCKSNHTWWATPQDVKNSKSWCPYCMKRARLTIERLQKIAKHRGGICLSDKYVVGQKLLLKCADGHVWKTHANSLTSGRWCLQCKNYNQEKCRDIFQKLLKRRFYTDRKILNGLELDGYCNSLKLGFEYNGQQHYDPRFYFHKNKESFKRIKQRDRKKRIKCRQKGICLITIPYSKAKTTESLLKFIANQLRKHEISLKFGPERINIAKILGNVSELKKLQKIASKRGITCLSKEYINTESKLLWKCGKGHEWFTTPTAIKVGYGCPECQGKKRHTIDLVQEIAKKFNGKCHSKKYKNVNSVIQWECERGHRWRSKFTNVLHGEIWCQKCKTTEKYEKIVEIAKSKGGKCVSRRYINNDTHLTWQCSEKHIWKTSPAVINAGNWCPECNIHSQRLTRKDLEQTASERGFKLLTYEYVNNASKLLWQCKMKHKWYSSVNSIRNRKSGCPHCRWIQATTNPRRMAIRIKRIEQTQRANVPKMPE
jgi:hypothetical protein